LEAASEMQNAPRIAEVQPIITNANQTKFAVAAINPLSPSNSAITHCALAQRSNKFLRNEIFRVAGGNGNHKMGALGH
jgi:hypothetical protein